MNGVSLRVLTVNAHKGFGFLNRRFILHELREAVRAVAADVVFLQEVLGSHAHHARRYKDWPATPQYEFLADTIWTQHAYGRNAVYPHGDHGNALLSRFPIRSYANHDASVGGKRAASCTACSRSPGRPAWCTRSACTSDCARRIAGISSKICARSSIAMCRTTHRWWWRATSTTGASPRTTTCIDARACKRSS